MANFCDYKIKVIGSKKATLYFVSMVPALDYKEIDTQCGSDDNYTVVISGNCKWSINYDCREFSNVKIDLDKYTLDEIENNELGLDYWYMTMRQKSEVLGIEIQAHYWSEESGFDQFDQYVNGKTVKKRKIAYNYDEENVFNWKKLEFVGHEGEYDETVTGEEDDAKLMKNLFGIFGMFK